MAVRTAIILITAFVSTICECREQDVKSWTDRERKGRDEVTSPGVSTTLDNSDQVDDLIRQGLCRLTTTDPYLHKKVVRMLTEDQVTLIEYQLSFANYSQNPLKTNVAGAYDAKKWSRVTTAHGQTLLSLAFNYGALAMMTLMLGTKTLHVELDDWPPGCMEAVDDQRKIDSVRQLLMRDFDSDGPVTTVDDDRVCYAVIEDDDGYAKFRHNCCYHDSFTGDTDCTPELENFWLNILYSMLTTVRLGVLFFGPSLLVSAVLSMSENALPYAVPLKSKLAKTVCFYRRGKTDLPPVSAKQVLDLSSEKGFPKLLKCLKQHNVQLGHPVKVFFSQYDINVDYRRMQEENKVPVGLFYSLYRAVFGCQLLYLPPFRDCCKARIFRSDKCKIKITWGKLYRKLANILLVICVPIPFYLRLVIFYQYEYEELEQRKRAMTEGGLKEPFKSNLIYYFTPTHGVFVFMYILYAVSAIVLAFMSKNSKDYSVKNVIFNSFHDLKSLSFTDALSMIASNIVWPLKKFGALGFCVGIIYWPLVITGSLLVGAVYLLPTVYLTLRIACHSRIAAIIMFRRNRNPRYKVRDQIDLGTYRFGMENIVCIEKPYNSDTSISRNDLDHVDPGEHIGKDEDKLSIASVIFLYSRFSWLRIIKCTSCAFLGILTLYAVVIILSEVIGSIKEIIMFTIMGSIVNASVLLKYMILILVIVEYCGVVFNNMQRSYLKINKVLFYELRNRIKDLDNVTSLPSWLQENYGFKAKKLSEQAYYEASDDLVDIPPKHWMINDLVLFVDNTDTPRIPIQLFRRVIQFELAGVPGPIYRAHIEAFRQLSVYMLFVLFMFIIVLSFSSMYKLSATNETLATMVGGLLPRMLQLFLAAPCPDVYMQLSTVSFRSKMNEIIENFCQYWPIYDLPFEVATDEEEEDEAQETFLEESKLDDELNDHAYNSHDSCDVEDGGKEQPLSRSQHPTSVELAICIPEWPNFEQFYDSLASGTD